MKKNFSIGLCSSHFFYLVIMCAVIIIDRLSKKMVVNSSPRILAPCLTLTPALNRGLSWSLFNSQDTATFLLVSLGVFLFFIIFSYYTYQRLKHGASILGESLIIAGAFSNLLDRIVYHGVVDFIIISCGNWAWPSFNIADIAICLGSFIMIIHLIREQS